MGLSKIDIYINRSVVFKCLNIDILLSSQNIKYMDQHLILSFIAASVLLTLMPGPDIVYVVLESISKSARVGWTIALGLVSGLIIHTILAATGISLLIEQSDIAYTILKTIGAIYLFQLAYGAISEKKPAFKDQQKTEQKDYHFFSLWRKGFFMNVLNPKVSLFFIALFPQFITTDGYKVSVQMIILGAIFFVQAIIIFTLVCFLAGRLSPYLKNDRFWTITKWAKIAILLLLAIGLILSSN